MLLLLFQVTNKYDEAITLGTKIVFMKDGQIVLMGDVEEIRQERGESVTDLYRQIYG